MDHPELDSPDGLALTLRAGQLLFWDGDAIHRVSWQAILWLAAGVPNEGGAIPSLPSCRLLRARPAASC